MTTELLALLQPDRSPPSPPVESQENISSLQTNSPAANLPKKALTQLEQNSLIYQSDQTSLFFFQGEESPEMLQQVGLGRSATFAAIGAGSGAEVDLSDEDFYYHHLVLWDRNNQQLIGAYRIGVLQSILAEHGTKGIYLDHLFEIDPTFYSTLGNSLELSRSFILPHYQRSPKMLDLLWKGLGIIANKLKIDNMFGSVTISDTFTPLSQAILVHTLDTLHSAPASSRKLIQAKFPFQATTTEHPKACEAFSKSGLGALNKLILELEENHRPIPPLIRYYLALGAKFLSFQVEPSFNNAIYCLLQVNLAEMPPRYKKRFLG